jgi:hypothetical protein
VLVGRRWRERQTAISSAGRGKFGSVCGGGAIILVTGQVPGRRSGFCIVVAWISRRYESVRGFSVH